MSDNGTIAHTTDSQHQGNFPDWFISVLDNTSECVLVTDQSGKILYLNQAAADLLKAEGKACINKPIEEIYTVLDDVSDETYICWMMFNKSAKSTPSLRYKTLVQTDGTPITIEEKLSPLTDQNGNITGTAYFFSDISDRIKMESQILASRNLYLRLFEEFPIPIWRTNARGEFNYFNQSWLDFTGKKIDFEIGARWIEGVHPDDKEALTTLLHETVANRTPFNTEFRLRHHDGYFRSMLCFAAPFSDYDNKFSGFVGGCFDISARKAMEEDLRRAKTAAESATKMKSEFISNMSHEIRTPMNGIIGLLDLLRETKLSSDQKELTALLNESANNLLELLNNILYYSKLEAFRVEVGDQQFNLYSLIADYLKTFTVEAKLKGLRFTSSIDSKIPETLIGSPLHVKQIIINLLNNAKKFTEKGSIQLKIVSDGIDPQNGNVQIHCTVSDTGIGISKEQSKLIFDEFTQGDGSLTRKYGGSGLGLSIVKHLIDLMHGSIWVESEPGKGSVFHCLITLKDANHISKHHLTI